MNNETKRYLVAAYKRAAAIVAAEDTPPGHVCYMTKPNMIATALCIVQDIDAALAVDPTED